MRIAVLGGGLAGITTAWCLAKDGHEVTIVEKSARVADAASGSNGGIVSASRAFPWPSPQMLRTFLKALVRNDQSVRVYPFRWDPAFWAWGMRFLGNCTALGYAQLLERKVRYVRYSQAELGRIAQESGVAFHRREGGVMYLYRSPEALAAGMRKVAPMQALGFEFRLLDKAAAVRIDPGLANAPVAGAVFSQSDESGDSAMFCRELAAACEAMGATLRLNCEVRSLVTDGDRVSAIETSTGRIAVDGAVAAMGLIEGGLRTQLGADLPIYPVKGCSVTIPITDASLAPRHAGMDESKLVAYCPMGDRLRLTGGAEFSGYSRTCRPGDSARLVGVAKELFPGATDTLRAEARACLRPMTPESTPLFGTGRYRNLWFNAGLGHMGWTMAAGGARITADLIAGRPSAIPLDGLLVRAA
ncbi:MAG: FAD-dependent oxidoreductase [Betaproteobacteria bacterium]